VRSAPSRDSGHLLTASRPLLRAFTFAGVAVPVSLAGHLADAGAGARPDEATLLLAVALVTVAYRVLLAGRERSWPLISAALGGTELILHVVFGSGAGHVHSGSGLTMTAGHAIAALVLGWFLRGGERALWSAARRLAVERRHLAFPLLAVLALLGLGPIAPARIEPRGPTPSPSPDAGRRRHLCTGGVLWRGPPCPPAFGI
jgi:hypothetical protein